MKNESIFIVLLLIAIVCLSWNPVFASSTTIHLYTDQAEEHTIPTHAYRARCLNVYNYSFSDHGVYCILYKGNVWGQLTVVNHLVDQTETYTSGWIDYTGPGPDTWQLTLNPYGWLTTGCRADGTLNYE